MNKNHSGAIFKQALYVLAFLVMYSQIAMSKSPTPAEIVKLADEVRNPQQPFSLECSLTEFQSGKESNKMEFRVYSKKEKAGGQFRTLVRFISPAKDQGKLMLKDRDIIWFYDPSSKSSVRLSPQQRLMGQASNGDVVTVNYADDYKATLEKTESITDPSQKSRNCYKLNLTSAVPSATYAKIEYWVDSTNNQPVKGKFYSDSGALLKIIYYQGYQKALDAVRPTEILIIDGLNKNYVTKMNLSNYKYEKIPDEWFQKDYLSHVPK